MSQDIRLLVIDFDGTALGGYEPYGRFPDNLSLLLDEMTERGYLWASCTTWHPFAQEQVFSTSLLKSRPIRAIGRTSLSCGLYIQGALYLDAVWDAEMIAHKSAFMLNFVQAIREFLRASPDVAALTEYFDYIFAVSYYDREIVEKNLLTNELIKGKTYPLYASEEKIVFLFPWYLSKGLAVRKLQKVLNITAEQTLVAGDGINDLPMLEPAISRWQVCPQNADVQVKEKVVANGGIVASQPYSDGVVKAIRETLGLV
ncbi:MAG: HAD hydrolase family protein [Candidatus Omnitrophica bacterium]|nr:HAD hydrolase family protein [Candidatus Omnitrophota bacterium]